MTVGSIQKVGCFSLLSVSLSVCWRDDKSYTSVQQPGEGEGDKVLHSLCKCGVV